MDIKHIVLISLVFYTCSTNHEIDCTQENDKKITLANSDDITIPPCWQHEIRNGIDSDVGAIFSDEDNIFITYDIGELAGNYVEISGTEIFQDSSINELFIYSLVDKAHSTYVNCCAVFTFPERGPANFVLFDIEKMDDVLPIIKSYESN